MKSVKLMVVAAAVAIATTAIADANSLLYWMVDNPTYNDEAVEFDYATIKAVGQNSDASYLYLFNQGGKTDQIEAYTISDYTTGGIYSGLFDGSTVDNFLIELFNASNDLVAWQNVKYSQASANGSIATTMAAGGANVYSISQVVPEPTSGLLLLLGFAGLALRRRKI